MSRTTEAIDYIMSMDRDKATSSKYAWMRLSSGRYVNLFEFSKDDIYLFDVVTSLSELKRCNGHHGRAKPLSVLQHSCLTYDLAVRDNADPEVAYAALVHDCHESIVGDFTSPNKFLSNYDEPPHIVQAFREYFGLFEQWQGIHAEVKKYDYKALNIERIAMWPYDPADDAFWPKFDWDLTEMECCALHKQMLDLDELDFHWRLAKAQRLWRETC